MRVEATASELMEQAAGTTEVYLREGVAALDRQLGEGYAVRHPELLAAFMRVAAADFHSAQLNVAAQLLGEAVQALGRRLAEAVEDRGGGG